MFVARSVPASLRGSAMNQDRRSEPNSELPTVAHAVDASGQTIAGFRVLQKLGEGGMGVVYEAEQDEPIRRRVALVAEPAELFAIRPGGEGRTEFQQAYEKALAEFEKGDFREAARLLGSALTEQADDGPPWCSCRGSSMDSFEEPTTFIRCGSFRANE